MPIIPYSPNPEKSQTYDPPGRRGKPMLFQVTDLHNQPLYPYVLAMHINPNTLEERMMKSKNVAMTRGGFVEWIWPDELDSLSASATTGTFIGPDTGLVSGSTDRRYSNQARGGQIQTPGRQQTIAWERQEDLLELFHNNGIIYNGNGQPVLRGRIMCIYDRGIFIGHFTTFSVKETNEKAFSFDFDWEFKVESTVYVFPASASRVTFDGNPLQTRTAAEFVRPPTETDAGLDSEQAAEDALFADAPVEADEQSKLAEECYDPGTYTPGANATQEQRSEFQEFQQKLDEYAKSQGYDNFDAYRAKVPPEQSSEEARTIARANGYTFKITDADRLQAAFQSSRPTLPKSTDRKFGAGSGNIDPAVTSALLPPSQWNR